MSVINKFINAMKGDDGYYDEEDEYYDEDDEVEVEMPRRASKPEPQEMPAASQKVTQMSRGSASRTSRLPSGMEVCVIKPTTFDDATEITDTLLNNRTVVLNLEGLNVEIAQRIIDFTSGSTYAIKGNFQKISQYIFIITPSSVDISGDFLGTTLSGGIDIPSVNRAY